MQPGRGINADPASLDTHSIAQYTTGAVHTGTIDFLLNIVPDSFLGAFTRGEMLQVLLLAVLSGIALATLRGEQKLVALADSLSHFFFKMVALVMEAAPLGAVGAMAFTIGRYGVSSLLSLGKLLLCCYAHQPLPSSSLSLALFAGQTESACGDSSSTSAKSCSLLLVRPRLSRRFPDSC